jgi:hypothetical protein
MAEFLANESETDLVAQLQSSIRAGIRRTDTGVTHAAMNTQNLCLVLTPTQRLGLPETENIQQSVE